MAKNNASRQFSLSYPELIQISKNLCEVLTRDADDLSIFGVSAPAILNLTTMTTEFENTRVDLEYSGDAMIKTDAKNVLFESVLDQIRFMNARVIAAFGENSLVHETFKIGDINNMSDIEAREELRRIIRRAEMYITELSPYGVNPALITSLKALTEEFSTAISEQENILDERRLAAAARIEKANEIYNFITSYSNFGKKFYGKTNPAKYQDYVIYDSFNAGTLTTPTNLSVDVGTMVFSWDAVPNATSYVLLSAVSGSTDYETIYTGTDNFVNYVPPSSGIRQYKVKARSSSGFGPESGVMLYNYVPVLAAPGYTSLTVINANTGAVAINWESVEGASFFRLFSSQVAIGAEEPAAGLYSMVGEFTVASYSGTINTGYRHWFFVVAGNTVLSAPSDSIYVDMPLVP